MDPRDRSGMFKSRTGTHSRITDPRDDRNTIAREKRTNARSNAYASNRHIEPTPKKPAAGTSKPPKNNANAVNQSSPPKLSRQQAFRLRFMQYREQKATKKATNTAPAPFTSAVPVGRFIGQNEQKQQRKATANAAIAPPVKPSTVKSKKPAATASAKIKTTKDTKFSPINTRSRNRDLLSPSQLPTPRRRSRKSFVPPETNDDPQPKTKTPTTTPKTKKATGPRSALVIAKTPTVPNNFKFEFASTAIKDKVPVGRVIERRESLKQLFEDSISPIENSTPKGPFVMPKNTEAIVNAAAEVVINVSKEAVPATQEIDLNTTPDNAADPFNTSANYVSPFVTISRGSRGSRAREEQARNTKYTLNSRRSLLNESVEDRQNTEAAAYFRQQMSKETERLTKLVDEWLKCKDEGDVPAEYVDLIDVTVGQTRLLYNNKFIQFRGLVEQCENGNKEAQPVRPIDLEGFWNMVFIQVENCDKRFERLNQLKSNNWVDPELKQKLKKPKKTGLHGVAIANGFKAKATRPNSTLATMLKAARRKYAEDQIAEKKSILTAVQNESLARVASPRKSISRKSLWIVCVHSPPISLLFLIQCY